MANKATKKLDEVLRLLNAAPVPVPWFPSASTKSVLSVNGKRLRWSQLGSYPESAKIKSCLERRTWWLKRDAVLMIAGSGVVIHELPPKELLVQSQAAIESLDLTIAMVDSLAPISNLLAANSEMDEAKKAFFVGGGETYSMKIPTDLPEGKNSWLFERPFSSMPTILALTRQMQIVPGTKLHSVAIFEICPQEQIINVLPLDWFNSGGYDYDYQWLVRIVRNQADGRLYGQGVRLGIFSLTDDGKQVREWLRKHR
jgi:hypothetical protein